MKTNAAAAWMRMPARLDAAQIHRRAGRGDGRSGSTVQSLISAISWLILFWCWALYPIKADVDGIAPDVPEPKGREVIVQLFNWPFTKISEDAAGVKTAGLQPCSCFTSAAEQRTSLDMVGSLPASRLLVHQRPLGNRGRVSGDECTRRSIGYQNNRRRGFEPHHRSYRCAGGLRYFQPHNWRDDKLRLSLVSTE